ncbi:hypothetical protein ACPOL_6987 (plasmid) [Acidisarcina polymorpha]|uniref:ASPIC/UnbV domain-containing protein n=1 Tax=Acidisarcina polymorpha TaxID=2211140 RepID=A0A2Z5GB24_9BACT|nr:hypothetical protein ACPOL_6987 [Acidisarcina polymorpha]
MYRNRGNGSFEDVSARAGSGIALKRSSRGVAFGDIFNTGQTDILVSNMNESPTLLRNYTRPKFSSLTIQLRGKAPNLFAIGGRVSVVPGTLHMMNEVQSGGSYLSQNDLRLRFGLGSATKADRVLIRWPDGHEDALENVAAGQYLTVAYGGKILSAVPYGETPGKLKKH